MNKFIRKFIIKGSKMDSFKRGTHRYEWHFANMNYSYGSRLIKPYGAFSEVEHLCSGVVRDLQQAKHNAATQKGL